MDERTAGPARTPQTTELGRRQAWRLALAGAGGAAAAAVAAPSPASADGGRDSAVSDVLQHRGSRSRRVIDRIIDRRLAAFERHLVTTVLPRAVARGDVRSALDTRYVQIGTLPVEATLGGSVVLTQAEYDALGTPDPAVLYVIVG